MIEFTDVAVHFGTQDVLDHVSLRIHIGERIGIVGPNGAGKSTLFQLILGTLEPDHGIVRVRQGVAVGYARQHPEPTHDEETLLEYSMRGVPKFHELETALATKQREIDSATNEGDKSRLLKELGVIQSEFEHIGGFDLQTRVQEALGGLGFDKEAFSNPFKSFSGGWRMRAELARILASKPGLLLLDEPSNYLDIPAVEWLQRFLRSYEGTLLIISHDRYLLRSLTKITVEVDSGQVTRYSGDFDYYIATRDERIASLVAAKANQDRRKAELERFIDRFKAKATKASQAQSRMKQLEKMEEIVLPKRLSSAGKMRLSPAPHSGEEVMRFENASFSYSESGPEILKDVDFRISRGDRIGVVGFNGMGKTTLLRLMAGTREPTKGARVEGYKVVTGYQSQEFAETIDPMVTVIGYAKRCAPNMAEKDLRTQLGSFGFTSEDIDKTAGVLSGGEKIRLAFFALFIAPRNFLLLDEPTTHLDLEGRRSLENALASYNGTLCFVSHDVEFVRAIAKSILWISPEGVKLYPGTYDEFRSWLYSHHKDLGGKEVVEGENSEEAILRGQTIKTGADAQSSDNRLNSKELRKAKAELRAKMQPKIAPLKKKVETLEKKISELEEEEKSLNEKLSSGETSVDFAALGSNLRNVQFQLGKTSLEWEEAAMQLEALQQELDKAQEEIEK